MNKHVDILLATYEGSRFLEEQLESIFGQTYSHFHLWIRDDSSSDQTVEILSKWAQHYPEKITLLKSRHGQRLGAKGNFSELMEHSSAPYIFFSDQDDKWFPHKIEESLTLMQKNESFYGTEIPILIHTDLIVTNQNLQMLSPSFWSYSKLDPHAANSLNRLLTHNVITGCTMLINRSLLKLAKPIPSQAIMHDWWIGLIASAFGKIDYLTHPTLFYRQHGRNDIGATNWRSWSTYLNLSKKLCLSSGRNEFRQRLYKTIDQSIAFFQRFQRELEKDKRLNQIVTNYASLNSISSIEKRYLFLKNSYYKNTLLKNIGMFLFL